MICPNCKATIADIVKRCPYCNHEIQSGIRAGGRTSLGKISLILAIASISCIIGSLLLIFSGLGFPIFFIVSLLSFLCLLFPILAIILGAIAYFGKTKDSYGLIGFVLGICFLVAGFFVIPAATYLHVSEWMPEPMFNVTYMKTPSVFFVQDDIEDTLTVVSVYSEDAIEWSYIVVDYSSEGGVGPIINSGPYVAVGDQITGCSGTITIEYAPTDVFLGSWTFT
jgi:hypothetical protein